MQNSHVHTVCNIRSEHTELQHMQSAEAQYKIELIYCVVINLMHWQCTVIHVENTQVYSTIRVSIPYTGNPRHP